MRFLLRQLKRLGLAVIVLACCLVGSIPATWLILLARFRLMESEGAYRSPAAPPGAPGGRSMGDIFSRLEKISFEPVRPLSLGMAKAAFNNSFLLFLNTTRATSGRMYPYPPEFDEVTFESFDGTPLRAVAGIHRDGGRRPGIVLSHGFMGSKNDHYIIDAALTAYAGWGFNVLAVDLRNFGKSQGLAHRPTTAGWKEGEDLLAAAKLLGEMPEVTSVGVTGFSMGAGSTMRAAFMAKEYPYLTGGAIAWNGYADARRMVEYISRKPDSPLDPFFPVYVSFRLMHWLRFQDMKKYPEEPVLDLHLQRPFKEADFLDYVEEVACPYYGVSTDEYYRNASSREFLADVEVPLLIVHAADDPICPPSEMDELIEIAGDNPNVNVWMLPAGNHCLFPYLDRNWYENVMREFFSYWAAWE